MNIQYFLKNLILNPIDLCNEISADLKKEINSKKYKSKNKFIWICGLPKSGTTLVEEILDYIAYIRIDRSVFRKFPNKNFVNILNLEDYTSCFPQEKYSYIKTHISFDDKIVNNLINRNFKILIMFRDLRDVMISRYYHVLADKKHWQHNDIKSLPFEDGFIKSLYFRNEKEPKTNKHIALVEYYYWIKNWKKIESKFNLKKMWYEDYINNPHQFIKEILNFTDFSYLSEVEIEKKLQSRRIQEKNFPLFKKLNRGGQRVSTFRSGKAHQWKNLFNNKIEKEFNNLLPEKLEDVLK
jgi:hypothetical protein